MPVVCVTYSAVCPGTHLLQAQRSLNPVARDRAQKLWISVIRNVRGSTG